MVCNQLRLYLSELINRRILSKVKNEECPKPSIFSAFIYSDLNLFSKLFMTCFFQILYSEVLQHFFILRNCGISKIISNQFIMTAICYFFRNSYLWIRKISFRLCISLSPHGGYGRVILILLNCLLLFSICYFSIQYKWQPGTVLMFCSYYFKDG